MNKVLYKQQCHASLYLPWAEDEIDLTSINISHRSATISTYKYLTSTTDTNTKELWQNFCIQENVVEDVQEEERPSSLMTKKTRKVYIKTVNKKLHVEWNQDKRAGSIKNV